jgi:hypothetical protein
VTVPGGARPEAALVQGAAPDQTARPASAAALGLERQAARGRNRHRRGAVTAPGAARPGSATVRRR